MKTTDLIGEITERSKKAFDEAKGSHDWDHVLRVYSLCLHIGEKEEADMEVLKIAALLHDIGRAHQDKNNGKVCHAEIGAEFAKELISDIPLETEKLENILHCIKSHRFRGENIPKTKEAKILFDADKLDSIGAVGIGRAFLFAGEIGAKLHNDKETDIANTSSYSKEDTAYREFEIKLKKIKDRMMTAEGRRLAEERHEFMVLFFDRLKKEVEGDL